MINLLKRNVLILSLQLSTLFLQAQDALAPATAASSSVSSENVLLYLLIAGCAVLLVAIVILGNTWIGLARMASAKKAAFVFLLLSTNLLFAQQIPATPATETSFKMPLSWELMFGIFVFTTELFVVIWMLLVIRKLIAQLSPKQEKSKSFEFHMPRIFDALNASVPVEKEKDVLLDHNYDGIRELDNALPPWWKYSFYISIVWAFFYIAYYYFGGGPSSHDEYNSEVKQAAIAVAEYNKKNALNVDESNVPLADAAGISEGLDIYKTNCAACHGNLGEGNVGPNLTDDYWIHGGGLNDIYKTVKYGWPAKGMKSWEKELSPIQIKNVVGFIHSIHGTNPANAKAPQGELFKENKVPNEDSSVVAVIDTMKG